MTELSTRDLKLLEGSFFFRGAEREVLEELAEDPRCETRTYNKGETVFTPHTFTRALGVLLAGRVQVSKGGLLVSVLEPGDLFGAAALFNGREDYAATLTARARCTLLLLPQALVAELMARHMTLTGNYIRYLSERIRFLEGKLDGLTAGSAERKLCQYLLEGNGADCSLTDLAGRLGVGRTSLYRALDALCEEGVIAKEGKRLRVLDEKRLAGMR